MSKQEKLQELAKQMHALILRETQDLLPPTQDGELVRKKMSVFAFGIATELAGEDNFEPEEVYYHYLIKSGLNSHQAHVVVERTCLKHMSNDFADACFSAGKTAVSERVNNMGKSIRELLFEV